jgi:hypothetical protein
MRADLPTSPGSRFRGEQIEVTNDDGATTGDSWSIEPGTVTINALTLNGKQVTLDVFRQLKEAVLINHDGSLAGSPWGLVNYHQKRCDKLEKHAHVVWQLDNQLRQDTIQPPRWEPYRSDTCDAMVFAAGTMEPLPDITMRSGAPPEDPGLSLPRLAARAIWILRGHKIPLQPPPEEPEEPARFRWTEPEFGRSRARSEGIRDVIFALDGIECSGRLRAVMDLWDAGPELAAEHSAADRAALLAQLEDEVAAEKERRAKHEARWAEILDLPQLFIAV